MREIMGRSIVKQPDGLYAIWSTIVDNFVAVNCTADEAIQHEIDDAAESMRRSLTQAIERIETSGRAFPRSPTFHEAMKTITEVHGEDETLSMLEFIADKTDDATPTAQPALGQPTGRES